ncbi:uncharacterized protein G6M90_00g024710 [Metarhizium brunneum]|uniref:Uncharacterized protein n=1 Tax=Metarhizium brunneum TaxID=500148 RepID=A0A7D5YZ95_9HYPO|nr:hypothetical protein G6M90_00g024710 [Metarhizium brunneum]
MGPRAGGGDTNKTCVKLKAWEHAGPNSSAWRTLDMQMDAAPAEIKTKQNKLHGEMHLASHPRDDDDDDADAAQPRFNVALGSRLPCLVWMSGAVNAQTQGQTSRLQLESQDTTSTSTLTWDMEPHHGSPALSSQRCFQHAGPSPSIASLDCNVATTPPAQPGPSESRSATEPPTSLVADPRRHSVPESEPVVADQVCPSSSSDHVRLGIPPTRAYCVANAEAATATVLARENPPRPSPWLARSKGTIQQPPKQPCTHALASTGNNPSNPDNWNWNPSEIHAAKGQL